MMTAVCRHGTHDAAVVRLLPATAGILGRPIVAGSLITQGGLVSIRVAPAPGVTRHADRVTAIGIFSAGPALLLLEVGVRDMSARGINQSASLLNRTTGTGVTHPSAFFRLPSRLITRFFTASATIACNV